MNFKIFVLAIAFFICWMKSPVLASVMYAAPDPLRIPGFCYDHNEGHLRPGEERNIEGKCIMAWCMSGGFIQYFGCLHIAVPSDPDCYLTPVDFTKPFPQCCPDVECSAVE